MLVIQAIYENGVFRPLEPVDFPEGTKVDLHNLRLIAVPPGQDLEAAQRKFEEAMQLYKCGLQSDGQ